MNDLLLRPEQDVTVLRAENDPVQKVEVKRVVSPAEYQIAMQQRGAIFDPVEAQIAQQQAPLTSFGGLGAGILGYYGGGLGAQRYVPPPFASLGEVFYGRS